jgi:hypothetical protein
MSDITPASSGLGSTTLGLTPGGTDVSKELEGAGLAFGDLIKLTGQAVANTQKQLNKTSADTISALATTQVDVIAVQETVFKDDGTIQEVKSHVQKLPLINFIDPVVYQWSNVRLQGRFVAREFATQNTTGTSTSTSTDGSGQSGLLVIFGGGYNDLRFDSTRTTEKTTTSTDESFGLMRMNALLEPRRDVGVPKPRQAVQGPHIAIEPGEVIETTPAGGGLTRTMTVMLIFERADGTPIPNKGLFVETDGVPWHFTTAGTDQTDANGQLSITLERTFPVPPPPPAVPPPTTPIDVIVTVRKGLVSNATTVSV